MGDRLIKKYELTHGKAVQPSARKQLPLTEVESSDCNACVTGPGRKVVFQMVSIEFWVSFAV